MDLFTLSNQMNCGKPEDRFLKNNENYGINLLIGQHLQMK